MFQLETKLENVMDELWKLMQINKRSYRNKIRQTIDILNSSIEKGYDNKVSEQHRVQHRVWDPGKKRIEVT